MTITEAIPHRPPFLLVDEIVAVEKTSIRTRRRADLEDPVFKGHFPGNPILPGVLVCESIFQSAAILMAHLFKDSMENSVPFLTRVSNAKFKSPVRPGDVCEIEVHFKERLSNACFFSGVAKVNGKTAVSIDFACAVVALDSLT